MKTKPHIMPVTMKGKGFYDENSQKQLAIISATLPFVEQAAASVPLPQGNAPFTIVDYGCSEGKNSMHVVDSIIDLICQRAQNQPFNVIFNDLPTNNFNRLFENIYSGQLKHSPQSLSLDKGQGHSVLAFASAQPFYSQVVPAQTVHFGYSSSAIHWLSELPDSAISSHIFVAGASDLEKQKLAAIADRDLTNFLDKRGQEICADGRLIITAAASLTGKSDKASFAVSDETDQVSFDSRQGPAETYSLEILMNLLNEIMQELVEEKKISQQQYCKVWAPIYPRSLVELLSPLKKTPLAKLFDVEYAGIIHVPCPFFKKYLQDKDSGSYAQAVTASIRAFVETFLLHQLYDITERRRSARQELAGQKIVDQLFDRTKSRIRSRPEYYTSFPIQGVLVLKRGDKWAEFILNAPATGALARAPTGYPYLIDAQLFRLDVFADRV